MFAFDLLIPPFEMICTLPQVVTRSLLAFTLRNGEISRGRAMFVALLVVLLILSQAQWVEFHVAFVAGRQQY